MQTPAAKLKRNTRSGSSPHITSQRNNQRLQVRVLDVGCGWQRKHLP